MDTLTEHVWASVPYAPTAHRLRPVADVIVAALARLVEPATHIVDIGAGHGHLAAQLAGRGFRVTAVEPVGRMLDEGRIITGDDVSWRRATGERTGLPDGSAQAVVSSFGSMFCDPVAGPAEWARITGGAGVLIMTAWDERGFLAEMTQRMTDVMNPGSRTPPHMAWGDDDVARERLSRHFDDIVIEHRNLDWAFGAVDDGMRLYRHGSPTHAFSFAAAGPRRGELEAALHAHLLENADDEGRIASFAGYSLITARGAHG